MWDKVQADLAGVGVAGGGLTPDLGHGVYAADAASESATTVVCHRGLSLVSANFVPVRVSDNEVCRCWRRLSSVRLVGYGCYSISLRKMMARRW
jgi:hypothetical protein